MEYTREDLEDLISMQQMRIQDEADLLESYEEKLKELEKKDNENPKQQ